MYIFFVKPTKFIAILTVAFVSISLTFNTLHAETISEKLQNDFTYYKRISEKKNLNANNRLYILNRLLTKYKSENVDVSPLHNEIRLQKRLRKKKHRSSVNYRIQMHDTINVQVRPAKEFSTTADVNEKGEIYIDLLGPVTIKDLTLKEAEERITDKLKRYISRPDVRVTHIPGAIHKENVHLLGAVINPGKYPIKENAYLSHLITRSGGTVRKAQLRGIHIFRVDKKGLRKTIQANFLNIAKGSEEDILLQRDDIIWVPEKEKKGHWFATRVLPWSSIVMLGIIIALIV